MTVNFFNGKTAFDYVTEINSVQKAIENTEKRLAELKMAKFKIMCELEKFYAKKFSDINNLAKKIFREARTSAVKMELTAQDGKLHYLIGYPPAWEEMYCHFDYMGNLVILTGSGCEDKLASYSDAEKFKAAIGELETAIKRGDKEFKFPPDEDVA